MTIAVFNFRNGSVDIIHADKSYIEDMYGNDVERYLFEELCYPVDDICFMSDIQEIQFIDQDRINQIK